MSLHNLDRLFQPHSIAVIGASPKAESIGGAVMSNLVKGGFSGELFPVNPKYDQFFERPCLDRVSDAPSVPDLAVVAIPMGKIPPVIDACADLGVKGAVILSAGGREAGEQGRRLEVTIQEKAHKGDLRIIGPNCLGIAAPHHSLNASFLAHMPPKGKLAFISQSGAICSAMLDLSLEEKMGYRYFISIGSMLDVDFGDLIDYVGNDPQVSSVLLYIESLSNFRKFMSAARAVSRMKPIVVLKSGRSSSGARAAASHTGSMAGDDLVYDAAFKRAGAVRVRTLGDFFDCAELLAKQLPPRGPRLTILTNSGGPGVMAADAVSEQKLVLSDLSQKTLSELDRVLPPHWSGGNPIDILGDADARRYIEALNCISAQDSDGLLIILNPQAMTDPAEVAQALVEGLGRRVPQVFASWMGGRDVAQGIRILNEAGIPTYPTPEQAVRAFRYLYQYGRNLKLLQEIPAKVEGRLKFDKEAARHHIARGLEREKGLLTEWEAKQVLAAYSIPVNATRLARSPEEAREVAAELGFPLAMKISSTRIVHKSRAGGVRLGLDSPEEVDEAFQAITQAVESHSGEKPMEVSLQRMQARVDLELLLGAKKDPDFGPVLLFGWGGVHAETLADRNLALAPLNRALARRLLEGTRVFAVLGAADHGPGAEQLAQLEQILVCLSQLMVDFPQIEELDINPLALSPSGACALDARMLVAQAELTSPLHLSISPYPQQYEQHDIATDGLRLFIRPIKPEDAPLFEAFFNSLSKTTIYHRFFSPLKSLSREMLVRFTQIDYDREMALVALEEQSDEAHMVGAARVMAGPGGREGEFAVLVGDAWQSRGVGAELLARTVDIVKERGMQRVWGTALPENRRMAKLAQKLGFTVNRDSSGGYEMQIDL
jgi:acetyltransferase